MDESYEIPVEKVAENESNADPLDIKKKISDPTDQEYDKIISDIKAGVVYKNYDLKKYNNGGCRLIFKKQPTTRQKAVERTSSKVPKDSKAVYLTDSQLMMEHIFELQNKVTKLDLKNMKRKNKIHEIIDYYNVDENDVKENVREEVKEEIKEEIKEVPKKYPQTNNWRSKFRINK